MCVANGRGVEHQAAFYPLTDIGFFEPLGKVTVVNQHVGEPCKCVNDVSQQQVDEQCYRRTEC